MSDTPFRQYLQTLQDHGELCTVGEAVDLRYVSALLGQAPQALLFTNLIGYGMPLVGGLLSTRKRLELAFGTPKIGLKMRQGMEHPIPPTLVSTSAVKEVIWKGDEVDLTRLPLPVVSVCDGGPYISGGILIAHDPDYGRNAGMYRLMFRTRNTVGIDLVTPNNLNLYCQRAFAQGKPVEVTISLGTHPFEMVAACYKAAAGIDELAIAGGLRGEPVPLIKGETTEVEALAEAEIVLEGKILPEGWVHSEGRFGEFSRLMGPVHRNPILSIEAITLRRDAIFYALHMPWENIWIGEPSYEASAWRALHEAGVEATAINVTPGGCCHWHVIAAIKKQPGDGKNALLALLSIADIKHAIVTDDDINIFNPDEVEWAIATRVQADRDVILLSGARAKPLDPSLAGRPLPLTTAKMGIDATIPEGVPKEVYEPITYPFMDRVRRNAAGHWEFPSPSPSSDREGLSLPYPPKESASPPVGEDALASVLESYLAQGHVYFSEVLAHFPEADYQMLLRLMGRLSEEGRLERDGLGRYRLLSGGSQRGS